MPSQSRSSHEDSCAACLNFSTAVLTLRWPPSEPPWRFIHLDQPKNYFLLLWSVRRPISTGALACFLTLLESSSLQIKTCRWDCDQRCPSTPNALKSTVPTEFSPPPPGRFSPAAAPIIWHGLSNESSDKSYFQVAYLSLDFMDILEWSEAAADWTRRHMQEIHGIRPHISDRPSEQSTQLRYLSHLVCHYRSRSQKITTPSSVDYVRKLCFFFAGTIQIICVFSDYFYSHGNLILIIAVKQCMDIGAGPHVYRVF
jgi:hypothetical protein